MRQCKKCGETKDDREFYDEFYCCKACTRKRQLEYYAETRETNKEKKKEYYERNRLKINEKRKVYYVKNKEHHKEYQKEYNAKNKELVKERTKEYYAKNKEQIKETRLKNKYHITLLDWQEMYDRQNGKCAACGRVDKLEVDHNHTTGKVRELLCHPCNVSYGKLNEDIGIIQGLLRYAMKWNNT